MFVDTELLRSGAAESRRAAEHAHRATGHLSRAALPERMFGDFAAAAAFHEATGSAHAHHLRILDGNKHTLAAVGDNAQLAVAGFTAMDQNNAARVRACCSAT